MKPAQSICTLMVILAVTIFSTTAVAQNPVPGGSTSELVGAAADMMEKININTASIDSLASIPGLSPKIGEAIAAYREAHGAFKSIADLANVEGLDAGLLEQIKPFIEF